MFKSMLRPMLALMCLWSIPIAMIRAQPYDDSELRAFLAPPADCPAPCFMGIRPGLTAIHNAMNLLQAHEWVGDVSNYESQLRTDSRTMVFASRAFWFWNGLQPGWLDPDEANTLFFYPIDGRVDKIIVETDLTVGAIQIVLGRPDARHFASRYQADGYWWTYEASFIAADLTLRIEAPCPAGQVVRRGKVQMTFGYVLTPSDQTTNARTVCP